MPKRGGKKNKKGKKKGGDGGGSKDASKGSEITNPHPASAPPPAQKSRPVLCQDGHIRQLSAVPPGMKFAVRAFPGAGPYPYPYLASASTSTSTADSDADANHNHNHTSTSTATKNRLAKSFGTNNSSTDDNKENMPPETRNAKAKPPPLVLNTPDFFCSANHERLAAAAAQAPDATTNTNTNPVLKRSDGLAGLGIGGIGLTPGTAHPLPPTPWTGVDATPLGTPGFQALTTIMAQRQRQLEMEKQKAMEEAKELNRQQGQNLDAYIEARKELDEALEEESEANRASVLSVLEVTAEAQRACKAAAPKPTRPTTESDDDSETPSDREARAQESPTQLIYDRASTRGYYRERSRTLCRDDYPAWVAEQERMTNADRLREMNEIEDEQRVLREHREAARRAEEKAERKRVREEMKRAEEEKAEKNAIANSAQRQIDDELEQQRSEHLKRWFEFQQRCQEESTRDRGGRTGSNRDDKAGRPSERQDFYNKSRGQRASIKAAERYRRQRSMSAERHRGQPVGHIKPPSFDSRGDCTTQSSGKKSSAASLKKSMSKALPPPPPLARMSATEEELKASLVKETLIMGVGLKKEIARKSSEAKKLSVKSQPVATPEKKTVSSSPKKKVIPPPPQPTIRQKALALSAQPRQRVAARRDVHIERTLNRAASAEVLYDNATPSSEADELIAFSPDEAATEEAVSNPFRARMLNGAPPIEATGEWISPERPQHQGQISNTFHERILSGAPPYAATDNWGSPEGTERFWADAHRTFNNRAARDLLRSEKMSKSKKDEEMKIKIFSENKSGKNGQAEVPSTTPRYPPPSLPTATTPLPSFLFNPTTSEQHTPAVSDQHPIAGLTRHLYQTGSYHTADTTVKSSVGAGLRGPERLPYRSSSNARREAILSRNSSAGSGNTDILSYYRGIPDQPSAAAPSQSHIPETTTRSNEEDFAVVGGVVYRGEELRALFQAIASSSVVDSDSSTVPNDTDIGNNAYSNLLLAPPANRSDSHTLRALEAATRRVSAAKGSTRSSTQPGTTRLALTLYPPPPELNDYSRNI